MNKARREALNALENEISDIISTLQSEDVAKEVEAKTYDWAAVKETAEEFGSTAESIRDEEQEYYDNMPEGLKGGEKGENAMSVVGELDTAIDEMDSVDVVNDPDLDVIIQQFETARDAVSAASGY